MTGPETENSGVGGNRGNPADSHENAPTVDISSEEEQKIIHATRMAAVVVHEAVRKEGESELARPSSALAWSGLAAGLSMGFSLFAEGLLHSHIPDVPWRPLITKFGYTIGFLIVILGRQQLFTENTLTVILPLLHSRDTETALNVLRLWAVVLVANLAGCYIFALGLREPVFTSEVIESFRALGNDAMAPGPTAIFFNGIFGGWLIALMVWLLPGADSSRVPIIIIITYLIGLGKMSHIVAGSVETLFLVSIGAISMWSCVSGFMFPAVLGKYSRWGRPRGRPQSRPGRSGEEGGAGNEDLCVRGSGVRERKSPREGALFESSLNVVSIRSAHGSRGRRRCCEWRGLHQQIPAPGPT